MLLKIFQFYIPAFVKRKVIRELACLTAQAFRCEVPKLKGLSHKACLREYALFTNEEAQKLLKGNGDTETVKASLFETARRLGSEMRRRLHITKPEQVMPASRLLYRILDIELQQDEEGIRINRCFFSRYYSGGVCRIISSLDEGVAAGLSGGGKLEFYQRMTEGDSCCRADFCMGDLK